MITGYSRKAGRASEALRIFPDYGGHPEIGPRRAAFTAERRAKEIGILKVPGATVADIAGLLTKDFLKHVLFAIFIARPTIR